MGLVAALVFFFLSLWFTFDVQAREAEVSQAVSATQRLFGFVWQGQAMAVDSPPFMPPFAATACSLARPSRRP